MFPGLSISQKYCCSAPNPADIADRTPWPDLPARFGGALYSRGKNREESRGRNRWKRWRKG